MEYMKQGFFFENPEGLNESLFYSLAISSLTAVFTPLDFILGVVLAWNQL